VTIEQFQQHALSLLYGLLSLLVAFAAYLVRRWWRKLEAEERLVERRHARLVVEDAVQAAEEDAAAAPTACRDGHSKLLRAIDLARRAGVESSHHDVEAALVRVGLGAAIKRRPPGSSPTS
jgi:hypothetical protein